MGKSNKKVANNKNNTSVSTSNSSSTPSLNSPSPSASIIIEANVPKDQVENNLSQVNPSVTLQKPRINITQDVVFQSFSNFINDSYGGEIDLFFSDFATLMKRGNDDVVDESAAVSNVDINSVEDVTPHQLFESFLSFDDKEDTKAWMKSLKLPTSAAINGVFTSDLIGLHFNDLIQKQQKGKASAARKSFTNFLNALSRFQCFTRPPHLAAIDWKALEDLIVGYVVDKLFHFFIAKKITFKGDDLKRVRNSTNGGYTLMPSLPVKNVLSRQLKEALHKRLSYDKRKRVEVSLLDSSDGSDDSSGSDGSGNDDEIGDGSGSDSDSDSDSSSSIRSRPSSQLPSKLIGSSAMSKSTGSSSSKSKSTGSSSSKSNLNDATSKSKSALKSKSKAIDSSTSKSQSTPTEHSGKESTSSSTPLTTPNEASRSSPRKRNHEPTEEESASTETSSVKKKVISIEKFPNNPTVNYTYGYFNKVKQNSSLAQALVKKKGSDSEKASTTPK
jgi:hypothetical protein